MKNLIFYFLILNSIFSWGQTDSCYISFSHPEGIYVEAIELSITVKDSALLFYTLDGSKPNNKSKLYDSILLVEKPTAIRTVAYLDGKKVANATKSFIVGRNFDMAVVSLVLEPDDMFGYGRGIYVKGAGAGVDPPYSGANFWKGWERKVSFSFFETDGTLVLNQKAGLKIFGGFSKSLPMKSLSLTSRKKYEKKYFHYQFFSDKKVKKFKSIILRNSGGDFNKTHFRDALLTNLVEPLDIEIQAYRPVVVFVNGKYWGIHNLREKLTEHYLKSNGKANPEKVDLMKHRMDLQHGNRKQYKAFLKFLKNTDFSDTANVYELEKWMDIDNFMNYNITQIYIDNRDAGGNIRYWKPQNDSSKWRWILFDTDMSFGMTDWKGYKTNTLKKMTSKNAERWPDPAWSTFIIRKLLENDSLKNVYVNRFSDHLNTIFSTENVLFKLDSIKEMLNVEMPFHVDKWRSNNLKRWERNVQILRNFATNRPRYVRQHLMDKFDLTDTLFVEVKAIEKKKGKVTLNSLKIKRDFKGYYFKEIPIKLIAKEKFGYEFVEWKGVGSKEKELEILLTNNIKIAPLFRQRKPSEFKQKVIINELCLKSSTKDWIEIYNNSDTTIDITNWKIRIGKKNITLKAQKVLQPKAYYVIARRPSLLSAISELAKDSLPLGLSSKKGFIALIDANSNVVDSLSYHVKHNFKTDSILEPIILEKVNPNLFSPIGNWNLNSKPTIGKRNRAFRVYKSQKLGFMAKYFFYILGGGIGVFLLLLSGVFISRNKKKGKP